MQVGHSLPIFILKPLTTLETNSPFSSSPSTSSSPECESRFKKINELEERLASMKTVCELIIKSANERRQYNNEQAFAVARVVLGEIAKNSIDLAEKVSFLQNKLGTITKLVMTSKGLNELPECIGELYNLVELNVSGNKLCTIPRAITKMTNLGKLDLTNNEFKTLPDFILSMGTLEEVTTTSNYIFSLPFAFHSKVHSLDDIIWT